MSTHFEVMSMILEMRSFRALISRSFKGRFQFFNFITVKSRQVPMSTRKWNTPLGCTCFLSAILPIHFILTRHSGSKKSLIQSRFSGAIIVARCCHNSTISWCDPLTVDIFYFSDKCANLFTVVISLPWQVRHFEASKSKIYSRGSNVNLSQHNLSPLRENYFSNIRARSYVVQE